MTEAAVFILYVFFFLFLPGWQTVIKLPFRLVRSEKLFLSLAVGMAQVVLVGFVGAQLGARWLVWGLVGWGLVTVRRWPKVIGGLLPRQLPVWSWLILVAVGFQVLVMVKSGTVYQGGLAFWGVHGHDGMWHTALIQELARPFPPQNPGFAGAGLQNYHYFFDLFGAEAYRITGVSILDLYFRWLPILLALTANGLVFVFVRRWVKNPRAAGWSVFFFSFASSAGFLLPLAGLGSSNWETAFWAMQSATSLQNPPFYFSLIFILAALFLLAVNNGEYQRRLALWLPAILIGLLMVTKVYGGVVMLAALAGVGLWRILVRKDRWLFQLFAASLLVGVVLYLSVGGASAGFIHFSPGWFLRIMLEAPDRVNWPGLEVRRLNWAAAGRWLPAGAIWLVAGGLFFVGNMWVRLVGFWPKKTGRDPVASLLWAMVGFGFVPTLLLTQEYVAWNTIQFFYYAIFALGLLAGPGFNSLLRTLRSRWIRVCVGLAVAAVSIPGSLRTISWYVSQVPASWVSGEELSTLGWLRENADPEAVILVHPYRPEIADQLSPPVPLAYYNTAYVAFFSGRRVYLEDETAAYIQGYDYAGRLDKIRSFLSTTDLEKAKDFLRIGGIDYLYFPEGQSWRVDLGRLIRPVDDVGEQLYKVSPSLGEAES